MRNAYDQTRIASGSSGGTGAGIAANFATVGIGEDTGGSVRGPAAANNLVGLRPTTQLVSRHGMLPARPSTDTLGPIARSVKDAAIVLDVLAGYDVNDPITAEAVGRMPTTYTQSLDSAALRGARIGVIRQPLDPKADATSEEFLQVRAVIDRALADLRRLGFAALFAVRLHHSIGHVSAWTSAVRASVYNALRWLSRSIRTRTPLPALPAIEEVFRQPNSLGQRRTRRLRLALTLRGPPKFSFEPTSIGRVDLARSAAGSSSDSKSGGRKPGTRYKASHKLRTSVDGVFDDALADYAFRASHQVFRT